MTATHQTPPTVPAADVSRARTQATTTDQLLASGRALGPIIRAHADRSERERRLSRPVLDALGAAGFQSMFMPRSLGGLEVDPVTCARVVEEIASHDSAAGWALQVVNLNAWWAARLPDEGVDEIYGANPHAMMAAAFHPPQQATEVAGGYRVTGRAPLASNIHDCEWVLLSALVMDGARPRMTPAGPDMIVVILPTSDVEILDTWYTLGMRGTDSNDVAFNEVFVPARRSAPLSPTFQPGRHFHGPLYQFPAAPIIGLFGAAVLLASARGAISEFRDLAQRKTPFGSMRTLRERAPVQAGIADAEAILRSARALFYHSLSEAWARTSAAQPTSLEQKADLLLAVVHTARSSARVTDIVHRLAGTTGIYENSPIERHFRDAHTLRHHGFVSENKLETVGQIYLGLAPEFPLIAF